MIPTICAETQSIEKKQEVKDALCGSRTFYLCFHFIGLGLIFLYDNDLKDQIMSGDLIYPLFCFSLICISTYLFWTSGENPGYAPYEPDIELPFRDEENDSKKPKNKYIPFTSSEDQKNEFHFGLKTSENPTTIDATTTQGDPQALTQDRINSTKSHIEGSVVNHECNRSTFYDNQKNIGGYQQMGEQEEEEESKEQGIQASSFPRLSDRQEEEIQSCKTSGTNSLRKASNSANSNQSQREWVPELFYCSKCHRHQPFRSKHCNQCNRCINKFDHHCFWVGGCIGELNHRKFWLFLFLQTFLIYLIFLNYFDALDRYIVIEKNGSETYTQEYGAFAVMCFVLFIFFLFTGLLCAYHTFLICTNQTTWEHNKRFEISYTKHYPKGFYPFSEGIIKNLQIVFFHNNEIRQWILPGLREAEERQKNTFNILENEYYNCC